MRCLHVHGYSQTDPDPYMKGLEDKLSKMKGEMIESSLTARAEISMKQTQVERAKADLNHAMEREQVNNPSSLYNPTCDLSQFVPTFRLIVAMLKLFTSFLC